MRIAEKIFTGVVLGLIFTVPLCAQRRDRPVLSLKTKTEKEYAWNADTQTWQLSALMDYDYDGDGDLMNLVKYDATVYDSISRVDYTYTPASLLGDYVVSLWDTDSWRFDTKYSYTYTAEGKASQRILRWDGISWYVTRLDTLFQYDMNGLLLQSENFRWKDSEWLLDHTIFYEYGPTGKLNLKYSLSPAGGYLSQIIYLYDGYDRLSEMFAQFYREGRWENGWRRVYSYDRCSVLKTLVRQGWDGEKWVNTLMSEFEHTIFWNGPAEGKVNICHNGRSITVSVNVLEAFLLRGDCIGMCEEELLQVANENTEGTTATERGTTYTVFPNPASDIFTVRSADGLSMIDVVEIITMKGELIRSLRYNNVSEAMVYIGDIKPGRYFVVISGDTDWSSAIIVK